MTPIAMPVFEKNGIYSATLAKNGGTLFFIPKGEVLIQQQDIDNGGFIFVPEGSRIIGITVGNRVTQLLDLPAQVGTRINILPQ